MQPALADIYARAVTELPAVVILATRIERSELDGRTGYIKARTAKDNVVTFSVTRDSDAMSEVSVFVGPVGDQDAAQDILSRVERAMK